MLQILLGFAVIMIPGVSLFKITLYADYLNGIFLPIIFFFLYRFANNEELMGEYKKYQIPKYFTRGIGCGHHFRSPHRCVR